jgi:AAA family ATP:ADP antiporter
VKSVRSGEWPALILSFLYFFLLLAAYYVLRPVRDGLVAGLDVGEIKYLVIAVFVVMLAIAPLFGFAMAHVPRKKLLPSIYAFFVVNLGLFAIAFAIPDLGPWPSRVFYVWLTVFNMFVVSVFWSFMADVWREEQGRRLFGFIASGGSVGGLLGPLLAKILVERFGISALTLLAAALLSGTVACLMLLGKYSRTDDARLQAASQTLSGSNWQGLILVARSPFLLGIASLVLIGTATAQFMYAETARLAQENFATPEARSAFNANLDLWTNLAALILQFAIVGPVARRFGIAIPLIGLYVVGFFAYGALAVSPLFATLAISNVARRSAEFGFGKPARDMMYTVTTPQEKYLAKNVIDTLILRGGDVVGGWLYSGLGMIGFVLAGFGAFNAITMIGTIIIAVALVRGYKARGGK